MIKFFRKIRQDLLSKGKTGKYFKYAIGEIVLVVIGILIALQINNWNIDRLERKEEIKILENLHSDFKISLERLHGVAEIRNKAISCSDLLFDIIRTNNNPYSESQLDSIFINATIAATFNGKTGTLDMLFNTGKINIISNETLKNHLNDWPGLLSDFVEEEIVLYNDQYNNVLPKLGQNLSVSKLLRTLNYRTVPFESFPLGATKSNYNKVFQDKDFEAKLTTRYLLFMLAEEGSQDLIEKARMIIEQINKDLPFLENQ